jgi:hypothetical protein
MFPRLRLAIAAWRNFRKGSAMASTMTGAATSTTTQNVAMGIGTVAGSIYAIIQFVRSMKPELLPWGPEGDAALVGVIATVIGPLVSRFIAMKRTPEKAVTAGEVADAQARVDGSEFGKRIAADQAAICPVSDKPVDLALDRDAICRTWIALSGREYAADGRTLGQLVSIHGAVSAVLKDGREWKA